MALVSWERMDRAYSRLARSRLLVQLAIYVRRATSELITHRIVQGGIDMDRNGEAWFLRTMAPFCRTFIDVGANRGAWSSAMLEAAPQARGIAYEPSLSALQYLRERLGADPRIEIVAAAVSDAAGELPFYEEPDAGETSSLLALHSQNATHCRRVRTVTVDAELERLGINHVDLLKVDAEGFDLHVLRGAKRALTEGRVGAVQFEYNGPWALAGATLGGALRLLTDAGFAVYVLRPNELRTLPYERVGELFAYSNFVALGPSLIGRFAPYEGGDALA